MLHLKQLLAFATAWVLLSCGNPPQSTSLLENACRDSELVAVQQILDSARAEKWQDWGEVLIPFVAEFSPCTHPILRDSLAEAYRMIGASFHYRRIYPQALENYHKGLLLRPHGTLRNRLQCNIGMVLHDQKEYAQALPYLDSARVVDPVFHTEPFYFSATYYSGNCYAGLGEYHFADKYFQQATELAEANSDKQRRQLAMTYAYHAETQRNKAELAAALTTIRKGLALNHPTYLSRLHLHAGNVWQDSLLALSSLDPNFATVSDSALFHTHRALQLYRDNNKPLAQLTTALNLGELYRRLGRYPEAEAILNPPIELLEKDPEPNQLGNSLLGKFYINRGETRRDAGDRTAAFQDYRAALRRLIPADDPEHRANVPDLSGPLANASAALVVLQDLAEWHLTSPVDTLAGLLRATEVYDSALVLTERLRSSYTTLEDQIALARQTRPLVEAALYSYRSLANHSDPAESYPQRAFQLTEQRKATTLLSNFQQDRYLRKADHRMHSRLQQLREEQASINEQVHAAPPGSVKQQQLRRAWADQTARIRYFQDSLLRNQPTLRSFLGADRLLTIPELRREILDSDQAVLSYHYRPGQLDVFLLTSDSLRWRTVALAPGFTADLDTLNRLLADPHSHPSLAQRQEVYCSAAYRVYQQLFPDFGVALPERLIIVPDAPFLTLPFEALWTSPTPGGLVGNAPTDPFLLQQHVVSYAYSANLLAAMSRDAGTAAEPGTLAGFAARFPRALQPGRQPLLQPVATALPYLTPLPGEEEIERIAEHTRTRRYVGPEADRARFERADEQHRAVHVITHGIINEATPLFNFISFSQLADTLDTDQLLFLQDLYARGLDLELASFSACQTAQGKQVVGEGPMSLARGLAAAGVRSVVTQLWRVSIDDTKDWMPLFYREFTRPGGADRDRALASAKRTFIRKSKNHRDPSTWASGVLIGYSGPLALQPAKRTTRLWWAIPVSLGIFVVFFYRRRRGERERV